MITLGNSANMHDIKLGTTQVNAVYVGEDKVWPILPVIQEVTQAEAIAGDILFYNKNTQKLLFGRLVYGKPDYEYEDLTPIGIVTVPASHNVYGDSSCGVMSLMWMNYNTPTTGSTQEQDMIAGEDNMYELDIQFDYLCTGNTSDGSSTGTAQYSSIPSDKFTNIQCLHDTDVYYFNQINPNPSPYLTDGSRNIGYYQTESTSSNDIVLSYFDGIHLTQSIIDYRGYRDYNSWTPSTDSDFHAASCCDMFYTIGTQQKDWYLPTVSELGYMVSTFSKINNTITNLLSIYDSSIGAVLSDNSRYWSCITNSAGLFWTISTVNGMISTNRNTNTSPVRAFVRIDSQNTVINGNTNIQEYTIDDTLPVMLKYVVDDQEYFTIDRSGISNDVGEYTPIIVGPQDEESTSDHILNLYGGWTHGDVLLHGFGYGSVGYDSDDNAEGLDVHLSSVSASGLDINYLKNLPENNKLVYYRGRKDSSDIGNIVADTDVRLSLSSTFIKNINIPQDKNQIVDIPTDGLSLYWRQLGYWKNNDSIGSIISNVSDAECPMIEPSDVAIDKAQVKWTYVYGKASKDDTIYKKVWIPVLKLYISQLVNTNEQHVYYYLGTRSAKLGNHQGYQELNNSWQIQTIEEYYPANNGDWMEDNGDYAVIPSDCATELSDRSSPSYIQFRLGGTYNVYRLSKKLVNATCITRKDFDTDYVTITTTDYHVNLWVGSTPTEISQCTLSRVIKQGNNIELYFTSN